MKQHFKVLGVIMSYLKESLSEGEEIKKEFKLHWILWMPAYSTGIIGVMAFIGVYWSVAKMIGGGVGVFLASASLLLAFLLASVFMVLMLQTQEQGVTNKRIVKKTGLVARNTQEISLKALETVEIKQSILGRIFGFGNVEITGRGAASISFKSLANPLDVKRAIENEAHKIAPTNEAQDVADTKD